MWPSPVGRSLVGTDRDQGAEKDSEVRYGNVDEIIFWEEDTKDPVDRSNYFRGGDSHAPQCPGLAPGPCSDLKRRRRRRRVLRATCKQLVWSIRTGRNMPIWVLSETLRTNEAVLNLSAQPRPRTSFFFLPMAYFANIKECRSVRPPKAYLTTVTVNYNIYLFRWTASRRSSSAARVPTGRCL